MRCVFILLLIFGCTNSVLAKASELGAWAGEYEYSEAEPPDLVMDYVMKISAAGSVSVSITGHMTTIHLFATARMNGDRLLGIFYDRAGDQEWPKLGLKCGDRMVTLVRNGGNKYYMRWAGL